jgi:hypothetical protein
LKIAAFPILRVLEFINRNKRFENFFKMKKKIVLAELWAENRLLIWKINNEGLESFRLSLFIDWFILKVFGFIILKIVESIWILS